MQGPCTTVLEAIGVQLLPRKRPGCQLFSHGAEVRLLFEFIEFIGVPCVIRKKSIEEIVDSALLCRLSLLARSQPLDSDWNQCLRRPEGLNGWTSEGCFNVPSRQKIIGKTRIFVEVRKAGEWRYLWTGQDSIDPRREERIWIGWREEGHHECRRQSNESKT